MPPTTAAAPPLSDYPPLSSGPPLPPRPLHTSGHGGRPPAHLPEVTQITSHPSPHQVAHATSHTTPHQETGATHHHSASTYTTSETSEPQPARHQSPIQDPTTINTVAPNTQRNLEEEVETLRQEVKTLKLNQEILQKANQELRMMVASIHVTLKEEMSSIKELLVELTSQNKNPSQTTVAPPATRMEVDTTQEQTQVPTQHHRNKQTPQKGVRNASGHTTPRKDTSDLTVHLTNNNTHLPPSTPSQSHLLPNPPHQSPLSTNPPHQPPLTANTAQPLSLSSNLTQPPSLSTNPTQPTTPITEWPRYNRQRSTFSPTPTDRSKMISILQWNIHGVTSKAASLLQYIHTHDISIIVLQETLSSDASNMKFGNYQLFQQPFQQGGSRGLITLVKKEIAASLTENPPHLGDQVESLSVTVHLDNTTNIDVNNVYCRQRSHLNLIPLLERNQGRLTLLAGDFNAHHPVLEPWNGGNNNQRGQHIAHVLENFEEVKLHGEPQATHIAGGRLDLLLTLNAGSLEIASNSVPELLSDHWAQRINFTVSRDLNVGKLERKRWVTKEADWLLFQTHLTTWYKNYVVPDNVNSFYEDLSRAVQDAADASMPRQGKKKYNHGRKQLWYYDKKVKLLNKMSRQLTKNYKHSGSEEDKMHLQEWVPYAREQMSLIREEKYLQFTARLNHTTSMTQVWKKINHIRGKHSHPPAHHDPAGKAESLMRDYHEKSATVNLPEPLCEKKAALDPTRLAVVTAATQQREDTDEAITREELLGARKLSTDTAPGEDGITYTMLNVVCQVEGDPLLRLFNMSLEQGILPNAWTEASIVPIPKPNETSKYRPISLTSTMCKMLERILLNRLLYKIGKLDAGVNGFVQHRSTANCLANYVANEKAKTTVFIDIEKAFDRAQPLVILSELARQGVKGRLLSWIQHYLTDRKARVIFQGAASTYMALENGTPQGGVLSPTLFNILMNVLAKLPYPDGTQHIGYADDIVLQTSGTNSVTKMQDALNVLTTKCEEIGFTISQTKTKAMAKTRSIPPNKLQLQVRDIDWVATHKYLGVIVARNKTWQAEVQHLKTKCNVRNRVIRALSWKGMGATSNVILSTYIALVRSLVDYASPALINITASDAKVLETVQNNALRAVCGAPKWTKTENLRAEAQVSTLASRIEHVTTSFLIRTCIRDTHHDHVHCALLRHHQGQGGQGKWITKAATILNDSGVTWDTVRASLLPHEPQACPPWQQSPIHTTVTPLDRKKQECITAEMRQQGLQSVHEAMTDSTATYYTDGSVDQDGRSGAAFVCSVRNTSDRDGPATANTATAADPTTTNNTASTTTSAARVTDDSSSTQAELAAIKMAVEHAHTSHKLNLLINTDSRTAIASLCKQNNENQHLTQAIITTTKAIQAEGRSTTINWIPSHVGIYGNEQADLLAKQAAQLPSVGIVIPRTQQQLKEKAREHTKRTRLQQERETRQGGSVSARWLGEVGMGNPCLPRPADTRHIEVVRFRIRLGYPYAWELGITTSEEKRRCRLCGEQDSHKLQHYLQD